MTNKELTCMLYGHKFGEWDNQHRTCSHCQSYETWSARALVLYGYDKYNKLQYTVDISDPDEKNRALYGKRRGIVWPSLKLSFSIALFMVTVRLFNAWLGGK
jgi:hypothetical protein